MKKNIAVISASKRVFDIACKDVIISSSFNLVYVVRIEDLMGREFIGYIMLYDAFSIKDIEYIVNEVKLRIRD